MGENERDARDRALHAAAERSGAVLVDVLPGRSCGTCMMCCKVYAIDELNKVMGHWCAHAERGRGCKIYENRPDTCRRFYCLWRVEASLGPEWKPETARFVVALDLLGYGGLTISLDRDRPDAWRKEPYHSTIRRWARQFCPENKKVLIIDHRGFVTAVLPDRDVPVGVIGSDQEIVISWDGGTFNVGRQPRARVGAPAAEPTSAVQPIMASRGAPQ
jgi:hypothetical protein